MFIVQWKDYALKCLEKIDKSLSSRIFKKTEELSKGFTGKDVKYIKGDSNLYRLRVGEYRVVFELIGNLITVLVVGHRKNIYDRI